MFKANNVSVNEGSLKIVIEGNQEVYLKSFNIYGTFTAKTDAIQNLVNKLTELDTCTEYSQAASLRSDYEALSEDEKVLFAREKIVDEDESGAEVPVNAMTKLEYMEYLNQIKANTSGANNNAMMKIENTTSIYFFAIISVIGLASVLGYYFISKKRKFN